MIDAAAWQAFGGVAAVTVLMGGVALALQRLGIWRPGAGRAADAAIASLTARLDTVETEQGRIAGIIGSLPEARDLRALAASVSETRGDVKAIRASLGGIETMVAGLGGQVAAINGHLLERSA